MGIDYAGELICSGHLHFLCAPQESDHNPTQHLAITLSAPLRPQLPPLVLPIRPNVMRLLIAALAAVAVQPVVFAIRIAPDYLASPGPFYGLGAVVLGILIVAAAMVFLLGIPTYLMLRKIGRASWTSLGIVGALLGALPVAVYWPSNLEGYSSGHNWHGKYVDTYINGVPTTYAWLNYGEDIFFFGIHGLIGALTFHATCRALDRYAKSFKQV